MGGPKFWANYKILKKKTGAAITAKRRGIKSDYYYTLIGSHIWKVHIAISDLQ